MLGNKIVNKMIIILMIFASCITLFVCLSVNLESSVSFSYETKIFDTSSIIEVSIDIDEDDWQDLLENPLDETYYSCDITINGETIYNVGIRTKGNTSLSQIANDDSTQRYSFKIEFDHYIEGQTYYGLDKLILNNNYADATNMKEALIYDMFAYLGVDAPLYNYAKININDSYWGVYLALEGVEESFLMRNYGVSYGQLYKPENDMGGGNDMGDKKDDQMPQRPEESGDNENSGEHLAPPQMDGSSDNSKDNSNQQEATKFNPPDLDQQFNQNDEPGFENFGSSNSGADLNYSDDDLESYSAIWESSITDSDDRDHQRVVIALKNINEQNDLSSYLDIDNIVKYMAVHIFSVNDDSLSGSMAHNYYLYENDGILNIIPWDYNLAFGGFMGNSVLDVINSSIDDAFSITNFFDGIYDNEDYKSQYYQALQTLIDEYINGGGFDEFYNRVTSQIDQLVETDPNAFYTYDEYTTAKETLYNVVKLRAQSIENQLDGTDETVDCSDIDLTVMGGMNSGNNTNQMDMPDGVNNPFDRIQFDDDSSFATTNDTLSNIDIPELTDNENNGTTDFSVLTQETLTQQSNDNSGQEDDIDKKSYNERREPNESFNLDDKMDSTQESHSISNYYESFIMIGVSLIALFIIYLFIKVRFKRM